MGQCLRTPADTPPCAWASAPRTLCPQLVRCVVSEAPGPWEQGGAGLTRGQTPTTDAARCWRTTTQSPTGKMENPKESHCARAGTDTAAPPAGKDRRTAALRSGRGQGAATGLLKSGPSASILLGPGMTNNQSYKCQMQRQNVTLSKRIRDRNPS